MDWVLLAVAGLAAGLVSGLLGVGGGIVMTPVLHYMLGLPWPDAVALSLFVIAIQAPLGMRGHAKRGAVDKQIAIPLALGGVAGLYVGIRLEPILAVAWLKAAFAGLMAFAAYRLVAPVKPREGEPPHPALLVVIGVGAGIVSRLLGVGGGILTVPVLVLMGIPAHVAVGSSLVPVWTNAVIASIVNLVGGLHVLQAVPLAAGALVGAPLGVRAAHALPEGRLRRVVAVALILVAGLVAWDAFS